MRRSGKGSGDSIPSNLGHALIPVGAASSSRMPPRHFRTNTVPCGNDFRPQLLARHNLDQTHDMQESTIHTGIASQAIAPVDSHVLQVAAEVVLQAQSNTTDIALAAAQAVQDGATTAVRAVAEPQTDANALQLHNMHIK